MILTICLVTKGREKYLDQALESFQAILKFEDIRVLLIDNGADSISRGKLLAWQSKNNSSTTYFRFDKNDSRYSTIWPVIAGADVDWIIMPGDDDEIRPDILNEWRVALDNDPDLVAFASSAAVMNEEGVLTGEILTPSANLSTSPLVSLASAFHEPAFVWPGLFFRATKMPPLIPSSRYAFDWWVGINLLMAGKIATTESIGLNYRVHSGQESNLAPNRRKYFEGSLWLDALARSNQFQNFISGLHDDQRLQFWRALNQRKPIYGDDNFATPIVFSIARVLIDTCESPTTQKTIAAELALSKGVLLRDGESITLVNDLNPIDGESLGNVRVILDSGVCPSIDEAGRYLKGSSSAREFHIGCKHSSTKSGSVQIDCEKFLDSTPENNADRIVNAITKESEKRGEYEIALSSGEKIILQMLRSLTARLPGKVKVFLRKLKNANLAK